MLRNPELRKLLLIAAPVCAVFTAVCLVLDTTAGILTGVLSVLLLSLYLLDVRRRYRTMARLAEDIDAVLHGRRDVSFAQYTEGEVSLLRSQLRKMTVRLSEQADQLRKEKVQLAESMADISHQMRTPLTAVNLLLTGLSDPDATEEARQGSLRALRRQVQRMDWLGKLHLLLPKLFRLLRESNGHFPQLAAQKTDLALGILCEADISPSVQHCVDILRQMCHRAVAPACTEKIQRERMLKAAVRSPARTSSQKQTAEKITHNGTETASIRRISGFRSIFTPPDGSRCRVPYG